MMWSMGMIDTKDMFILVAATYMAVIAAPNDAAAIGQSRTLSDSRVRLVGIPHYHDRLLDGQTRRVRWIAPKTPSAPAAYTSNYPAGEIQASLSCRVSRLGKLSHCSITRTTDNSLSASGLINSTVVSYQANLAGIPQPRELLVDIILNAGMEPRVPCDIPFCYADPALTSPPPPPPSSNGY